MQSKVLKGWLINFQTTERVLKYDENKITKSFQYKHGYKPITNEQEWELEH